MSKGLYRLKSIIKSMKDIDFILNSIDFKIIGKKI